MKNTTMLLLIFILFIGVGTFIYIGSGKSEAVTGNIINSYGKDAQKITLSAKNYNYYPETIKVKMGKPVEITLDHSVYGCLRAFAIRDLGVNKYSKSPEQTIAFTPSKKGRFRFSCSMGMGYGTIIVE